jgi:hypothetical protein
VRSLRINMNNQGQPNRLAFFILTPRAQRPQSKLEMVGNSHWLV